jgi:hypothetical protein
VNRYDGESKLLSSCSRLHRELLRLQRIGCWACWDSNLGPTDYEYAVPDPSFTAQLR